MIDYDRVREIIESSHHSYYEREQCRMVREGQLSLQVDDVFRRVCTPTTRVLDIGCGNGRTLLRNAALFGQGVGLDIHAPHIRLAQENLAASGVANVTFVEGRADNLSFEQGSFDFIFSERGPLADDEVVATVHAVRVLRRGGTILVEMPGPLACIETLHIFDPGMLPATRALQTSVLDELCAVLARSGVDVQLAASHVEWLVFDDFYEWLKFHMSCWDYYEGRRFHSFPLSDEHRRGIDRFLAMTADSRGRIRTTIHRIWGGGIKK